MSKTVVLAVFCLLAVVHAGAPSATAQEVCLRHGALTNHLEKAFAEQTASSGLGARGMLSEVFVSPRGTWTVVATTPSGVSCIRAAGNSWVSVSGRENMRDGRSSP